MHRYDDTDCRRHSSFLHGQRGMRVAIVIDETPLPEAQRMAVTRWRLRRELLIERGCSPTLVLLRGAEEPLHMLSSGGETAGLGVKHNVMWPRAVLKLARIARDRDVDILVGQEVLGGLVAGAAGRLLRCPFPIVYQRFHTHGGFKLNAASRLAARLCTDTIAISEATRRFAIEYDRTPPDRVHVSLLGAADPNDAPGAGGIDVRHFADIPSGTPIVLVLARLRYEKGVDVLIRAAEGFGASSGGEVCLVVVGAGPEEDRLRSAAAGLNVRFVGHQHDIASWLHAADVVVAPSRREAFGMSVAEAMACGKPVVASRVGGLPEVVDDGVTGLLVDPGDPRKLADAVRSLLEDRDLRTRMGRAGRDRFQTSFTRQVTTDRMVSLWKELNQGAGALA